MGYVNVKKNTTEVLHLCREPSIRSWSTVIALLSLGVGAAYYGSDYLIWKMCYIIAAVFIGVTTLEDWEDCIFDKKANTVTMQKWNLLQKCLNPGLEQKKVVCHSSDIIDVRVSSGEIKHGPAAGRQVMLYFISGYQLPIIESITTDDLSECNKTAGLIKTFLDIQPVDDTTNGIDPNSQSDSSDSNESFEHIQKSDIVNEENETATPTGDSDK
ncbi:unnamed protein product [Owenia fusiformis]|uniref:Essential for reactive oxygen species protein n=1 Tax=Owenia fusiformis TaxID=6347 RepID=A0A8J1UKQ2_OWEFU|nr:unnamed protein product [Owenia fusiformis]